MIAWWGEVQRLQTRIAELEATRQEPVKEARHARVPPSPTRTATIPTRPPQGRRREASVGRAGGGRPRHPDPAPVIVAQAKVCPHGGAGVPEAGPARQAVYDTMEVPPVKPTVTRVEPDGGRCARGGQWSVAPVPAGLAPGPPFGAAIQRLATYLRYTPAIRDARLSALVAPGFGLDLSAGGVAQLFQAVKGRLDQGVAAIRTRLRRRRLIGRDEPSARVHGQQPWAWGFQHAAGCIPVSRPSRGQGVSQAVWGTHRPTLWGSDLYRAPQHHPAADWQVC